MEFDYILIDKELLSNYGIQLVFEHKLNHIGRNCQGVPAMKYKGENGAIFFDDEIFKFINSIMIKVFDNEGNYEKIYLAEEVWLNRFPSKMAFKFPDNSYNPNVKYKKISKKEYDRLLKIAYETIDKSIVTN